MNLIRFFVFLPVFKNQTDSRPGYPGFFRDLSDAFTFALEGKYLVSKILCDHSLFRSELKMLAFGRAVYFVP